MFNAHIYIPLNKSMSELLLASALMNQLHQEIWRYSVIVMGDGMHTANTGFVCNQQITNIDYKQVAHIYKMPLLPKCPIYCGGPVNTDRATILHSNDYRNRGTQPINEFASITFNAQICNDIKNGKGPTFWKVMIGFSLWQDGQLDAEMSRTGGWLCRPWDPMVWANYKMKSKLWKRLVRSSTHEDARHFLNNIFTQ